MTNKPLIFSAFFIIALFSLQTMVLADYDLAVTSIGISPLNSMIENKDISFEIKIANYGTSDIASFALLIDNGDGTNKIYPLFIPANTSTSIWHHKTYSAGNYNLIAAIDYANAIAETNEGNNNRTISFEIKSNSSVTNDFSVDTIRQTAPVVYGETANFIIVASNEGNAANNVALYIDYGNGVKETKTINFIANETKNISASTTYNSAGNYYIRAVIDYGNNVIESDETNNAATMKILSVLEAPGIGLAYETASGSMTAGQDKAFSLTLSNSGAGRAYSITGQTILDSFSDSFSYSSILSGSSETRSFNARTDVCGTRTMRTTVNYADAAGTPYSVNASTTVSVMGSDLEITKFDVSDDDVYTGDKIEFTVKLKNNGADAQNAEVKIYRESKLIETIDFGTIAAGSTEEETAEWKVSGSADTYDFKAVADSDNECSNEDNNEEEIEIKIREEKSSSGSTTTTTAGTSSTTSSTNSATGATSFTSSESEGDGTMMLAVPAIALEAAVLVLLSIFLIKRKKN